MRLRREGTSPERKPRDEVGVDDNEGQLQTADIKKRRNPITSLTKVEFDLNILLMDPSLKSTPA